VAIICHSPAALRHVKTPDGKPLVEGKEVTGFTNGEEEAVGLTKVVPFVVEDEMLRLGATFSKKANWTPRVVSDGLRITGQNPHSSGPSANAPLAALKGKPIARASGSRLVQHALCRPEIGGFEPFREPGIGFGELFEGILHTLPNPMPRQRHLGSQPPGQCALLFGELNRRDKIRIGRFEITANGLELSPQTEQLGHVEGAALLLDPCNGLVQYLNGGLRSPELGRGCANI
jgi:hypothetical protein